MEKVSPEALKKALDTLGLSAPSTESQGTAASAATTTEDTELQKAEKELASLNARIEELKNPAANLKVETINKAEIAEEIVKAFEPKMKALGTLIVKKDEEIEELKKGMETLTSFNEDLAKRLNMVEKTPLERKSIAAGAMPLERFEKAEKDELGNAGMKVLSIGNSNQRRAISKTLLDEAIKTGGKNIKDEFEPNEELAKAAQAIELRQCPAEIRQMLKEKFKIQVIA